ncbi:Cytochrome c peroxidase [Sulfurimonas denitrificans DSM 1251]|uniref:Cytochrome c peroxidase n=1 Tax=Sulfurimonas denitrificans (strain ATCC 33889 / DSM 1251) TaxID=326298 RepID=Q30U36_SULDN|nr:cytochrome-c peroxidase [Sulfurimonas denitrificans]ABB43495.1 Cytochrome c peroxidase [Sulfurimonas denitrificans DSM 1251]
MYTKILLSAVIVTSSLSADLLIDAKKAGLKPIPTDKKELSKLIDNPKNPISEKKVELGKKLYFDPRLSKSGFISCNSCHNLSEGGDDGIPAAIGHMWTPNPHHLNSPTVYNSVFFNSQFWDGRDPHLEAQAQGPMQAAPEMSATPEHVAAVVTSMPQYVADFKAAYGKDVKITFEKIADTIATFERTLVTPSVYDDFLNGKKDALTKAQKDGLKTFIDKGCATCHNGIALGGEMNAFNITGVYKFQDVGDFKGDKNGMVKVPTLRNITQTAPYFHNGQIWELRDAIKEMGRIQLGADINDVEVASIEEFLKALDGRKEPVVLPQLPASTQTTPKPDIK